MNKTRQRRLKNIERAKYIIWMNSKNPTDHKETLRYMRAVLYLVKLAKKA